MDEITYSCPNHKQRHEDVDTESKLQNIQHKTKVSASDYHVWTTLLILYHTLIDKQYLHVYTGICVSHCPYDILDIEECLLWVFWRKLTMP